MEAKPGTFENLSEEQEKIKNEIQKWLKEEKNQSTEKWNDWNVLRFCRARKFDVPKIKIMIENYLKWCQEIDMESIPNLDLSKYEKLKTLCQEGYCNVDKNGKSVYITRAKFLKADKIFQEYTEEELVKYYI